MKNALIILLLIAIVSCDDDVYGNRLTGMWNWTATCGGFTGGCGYANQDNFKTIQITSEEIITTTNGLNVAAVNYEIVSKTADGHDLLFEIRTENGDTFTIRTGRNNLYIEKGDLWESYERL